MIQQFTLQLGFSLSMGLLLGSLFFGGLWLTVKHMQKAAHPWLLFLVSALSRTGITVGGFWLVGIWFSESYRWQRMGFCLAGFIIARFLVTRYVRSSNTPVSGKTV